MRCLYEVLEVDLGADEATIRSAYRKLALKWHPDKNQADPTLAEERFKEIQNAYEILADKQERSWYDKHRANILRTGERHQAGGGGGGWSGGQRPDDDIDVFSYFTSACFSGFGDGPRGFYAVYDDLFARLAAQEAKAAEERADGGRRAGRGDAPRFGTSESAWPEVSAFYSHWAGFSSAKDFSWADEYNTAAAPNRRVRRAMDAENEKLRRSARREYNDSVRDLIAFLRRRDKRVAQRAAEEAARRAVAEAAEAARREALRAERAARAAQYQEPAWVRGSGEGSDGSGGGEEEWEDEDVLTWHCPACEKHFKSEAAFANHQRSKKHLQAMELLREALLLEEEWEADGAGGTEAAQEAASSGPGSSEGADEEEEEESESDSQTDSEGDSEEEEEEESGEESASSRGSEGLPAQASSSEAEEEKSESEEDSEEDMDEDALLERLMGAQRRAGGSRGAPAEPSAASSEEQSSSGGEAEAGSSGDEGGLAAGLAGAALSEGEASDDSWGPQRGKRGGGKGQQRPGPPRRQPAAAPPEAVAPEAAAPPPPAKLSAKEKRRQRQATVTAAADAAAAAAEKGTECAVCGEAFESRSQLFKHIQASGHAALKEPPGRRPGRKS